MDNLTRKHIQAILDYDEDYDRRKEALLADHEAKGHRIISGGQTGPDTWDVIDYRTNEVIHEGGGGINGYFEFLASDQADTWVLIDPITESLDNEDTPVTEGMPESLCGALTDWVRDVASDDDIAMVLGSN